MTAIRRFRLREMGPKTALRDAELKNADTLIVRWRGDTHVSEYSTLWLRTHCYEHVSRAQRQHKPVLWDKNLNHAVPTIDFHQLSDGNRTHLDLLQKIVDYGVVRVTQLPIAVDGIEMLEPYLAPFTENDFGRVFDLLSEPSVWDLSQSSESLDPHTDDPYRYSPPGIRILCCVEASGAGGGESEIVNGIAACEYMRQVDPGGFDLLTQTAIPYIRYREQVVDQGSDVHLRARSPIISVNSTGDVEGIRFHERSMATFDLSPDIVDDYYLALISLSKIINSGNFSVKHLLQPGEAFVFDNQQVLHGRTSFTGKPGRRHLRLSQMDRSMVHSRYRLLLSSCGNVGADQILSRGT